jgi:F0F1-type ATP synthase membrane subunit b/b'
MMKTIEQLQAAVRAAEDEVRRLEKDTASLEGQINSAKDELEREFQVDSVAAAEKLLEKLVADADKLTKRRDALVDELETILNENHESTSAKT